MRCPLIPDPLYWWLCRQRSSVDFYILESLSEAQMKCAALRMKVLGLQASHIIAFVFCFCSWAEGMSFLLISIWRLQTHTVEEGEGEGRQDQKWTAVSPPAGDVVSPPSRISSLSSPSSLQEGSPAATGTRCDLTSALTNSAQRPPPLWAPIFPSFKWCRLPASPASLP